MESIVINPKNQDELKFLQNLLDKLGVESQTISQENMEDIGLSLLMREANLDEQASEDEVMKKLKQG